MRHSLLKCGILLTAWWLSFGMEKFFVSEKVYLNKVWYKDNFLATFAYFDVVPVCKPSKLNFLSDSTFGLLRGDRLVESQIPELHEKINSVGFICTQLLDPVTIQQLERLIDQQALFDIVISNYRAVAPVGYISVNNDKFEYYLGSQWNINITYDGDEITDISLSTAKNPFSLTRENSSNSSNGPSQVTISYNIQWFFQAEVEVPSSLELTKPKSNIKKTSTDASIMPLRRLAVLNSFIFSLLCLIVIFIVVKRTLHPSVSNYLNINDQEGILGDEEYGWKLLHGDIFRSPPQRLWFSVCIGSGAQICFVILTTIAIKLLFWGLNSDHLFMLGFSIYLLSSPIGGFISANLYCRLGGTKWFQNMTLMSFFFGGTIICVYLIIHMIAQSYRSSATLPASKCLSCIALWCLTIPLTSIGAILGRRKANKMLETKLPFSRKTNRLPREIPTVAWKDSAWLQVAMSGIVCFPAIFIEFHYFMMSAWGSDSRASSGLFLLSILSTVILSSCISIYLIFKQLSNEDYRWWWRSFCVGMSIGLYLMIGSIYAIFITKMTGALQYTLFLGYSLISSWIFAMFAGFVTFGVDYLFIRHIYAGIKSD